MNRFIIFACTLSLTACDSTSVSSDCPAVDGRTTFVVESREEQDGNSPLHYAAGTGDLWCVQRLVAKGDDARAKNRWADTPLHWAALGGHTDVVRFLLRAGVLIDATSRTGETALHLAIDKGHLETVRLLLAESADTNIAAESGETPLDYASDRETRVLLINAGAVKTKLR